MLKKIVFSIAFFLAILIGWRFYLVNQYETATEKMRKIEIGMTAQEVLGIAGKPAFKMENSGAVDPGFDHWVYHHMGLSRPVGVKIDRATGQVIQVVISEDEGKALQP